MQALSVLSVALRAFAQNGNGIACAVRGARSGGGRPAGGAGTAAQGIDWQAPTVLGCVQHTQGHSPSPLGGVAAHPQPCVHQALELLLAHGGRGRAAAAAAGRAQCGAGAHALL